MITIAAAGYELVLAPGIGGAIASFTHEGRPVLRGCAAPNSPLDCGCFPLVPYCNRIRGGRFNFRGITVRLAPNMKGDPSPLHGQGWLGPWLARFAAPGALVLTDQPLDAAGLKPLPLPPGVETGSYFIFQRVD